MLLRRRIGSKPALYIARRVSSALQQLARTLLSKTKPVHLSNTMLRFLGSIYLLLCPMQQGALVEAFRSHFAGSRLAPRTKPLHHRPSAATRSLGMYLSEDGPKPMTRVQVAGVSVSGTGFHVMLQTAPDAFQVLRVTDHPLDQTAATSAEALTILQLLSGVDMAGAILPPDTLSKITVGYVEFKSSENSEVEQQIADDVASRLPKDYINAGYLDLNTWFQSRIRLPQCTLDEVSVDDDASACKTQEENESSFVFKVAAKGFGSVSVDLLSDVLERVCYEYRPDVSANFIAIALALRYKAPISLSTIKQPLTLKELEEQFPLYRSIDKLQDQSTRVKQNIERGFEINKLQAALRIAMERNDQGAVEKIRAKLDSLDSLQDLPVQEESDIDSLQ